MATTSPATSPPVGRPAAASAQSSGVDLDLQAVEGIPRETLVALLRRKDKELKASAGKLDKLEERYVKLVRFNKILMEDRNSFLRFCNELLPESDAAFEEAAAQESPVNAEALLRGLAGWRQAFEAAREDRRVFQQFVELAFPGDESLVQLFDGPSLKPEAFDVLQNRWVALEDMHNESIASVNALAREQMLAKSRELEEAQAARREADRRVEEMREQLTRVAREKAHMLTQRLQGGGNATDIAGNNGVGDPSLRSGGAPGGGLLTGVGNGDVAQESTLREAREAREAAERQLQEATEAAKAREQELSTALEMREGEARRLRSEVDRLREEGERHRAQARLKDEVQSNLQHRLSELEKEMSSNSFIERFAEQQAGRDAEVKAQNRQHQQMASTLSEIQRLLSMSYNQELVLKDRIRELEQSQDRQSQTSSDYLKHVVLKYVEYNQRGDLKAHALVPVLCTLLSLSPEERRRVEKPAIPTPLLYLNQAVGDATSWMRTGSEQRVEAMPVPRPTTHPALLPVDSDEGVGSAPPAEAAPADVAPDAAPDAAASGDDADRDARGIGELS